MSVHLVKFLIIFALYLVNTSIILIFFFRIISIIINPLVVAPFCFAILTYFNHTSEKKDLIFFISLIFSNLLPTLTIIYYKHKGKIDSLDAPKKEQRIQLLAIAATYYAFGFIILEYLGAPPIVRGLMFCYAINTAIVWKITMYWKISIHMIGLGGPITALWLVGYELPLVMGITIVLVAMSRIILKAHTATQVIAGTILAMSLAYIELILLFL